MESSSQTTGEPAYPVQFSVEYPDRELNRLTTAFRLIVAIPILIVAASSAATAPRRASRLEVRRRDGRAAVPGAAADDPVPAEVPALVVRLEPRAAPVLEPDRRLSRPDGRPLPLHRRAAGRSRSTSPTRTRSRASTAGCHSSSGCSRSPTTSCSSSSGSRPWSRWSSPGSRSSSPAATRAAFSTSSSASSAGRTASSATPLILVTDEYPPFRLSP